MDAAERREWVVARARGLGFDLCGIAPAADFEELARLPEWLARGYAGEMRYLHDPRRQSPQAALPGAHSIIVCALNYNTAQPYSTEARSRFSAPSASSAVNPSGWISRYAWGDDYHTVLGAKLDALLAAMRAEFTGTPFDARAYVDTGPVVERVAAHHAGLGWLGKNTCLINEQLGSWLFLGVILTTLELAPSIGDGRQTSESGAPLAPSPFTLSRPQGGEGSLLPPDLCGQCTQCIDACPTGAIVEPYVLDARRCISYLTIERRGPIPEEFQRAMGWHVFGCDICQDVCPFNRKAPISSALEFQPRQFQAPTANAHETRESKLENRKPRDLAATPSPDHSVPDESAKSAPSVDSWSLLAPPLDRLAALTEADFRAVFKNSAVKRTKPAGLARNAAIARKNAGRTGP